MLDDAAGPGYWNFACDLVLAAELGADQQHKLDQISRCLAQNLDRNRVAGFGQFVDRRSEGGKVRSGGAVA